MFSPDTSGRKLLSVPTPHTAAAAPSTQNTGIVSRFSGVTPRSASSRLTLRAPRLSASASRSSRRQRRASKSGSMNACRNDGGIVHTPYGEYVIVLMNKDFHDIIEYNDHPSMVYGARVSRMILDQILACEGELYK